MLVDRIEGDATRTKVEQIQTRFCELERLYIERHRPNDKMQFAKLLLLLSKLRALDALSMFKFEYSYVFLSTYLMKLILVAERLLCLQMNTDGQVQKCIFEVLHRETTNVVVVSRICSH